ncbi:MAG TPA: Mrp/NBP35 family ATP-binding protein [Gemmatimonadaceae bacterium]|jgi:ATP-binding protein involved in chromosome partitioning
MTEPMQARIASALRQIVNPRTSEDVLTSGMVRDVATTVDGKVRFTVLLDAHDPASLVRDARMAVLHVDGVTDVRVDVKDPGQVAAAGRQSPPPQAAPPSHESAPAPAPGHGQGRALPVMGQEPQSRRAAVPAPTPVVYPHLGRIIAISSGKGGVGKSTVAVNIAVALAASGARVGLMDADIYGPNIPRMMGVNEPPHVEKDAHGVDHIVPLEAYGVKLMSLGFIVDPDQPAIWRGPIVMKIITQFIKDVQWGELDYFLVDMPPGTGDAQLSLVQATHVHGAIIVTTPQAVAVGDALRGAKMFQRVNVPVLGIVENMSWLECEKCGTRTPLFGAGGGRRLAGSLGVPLLGEIPLHPPVRVGGDEGVPIVDAEPDSQAARALTAAAQRITEAIGKVVTV